MCTLDFGAENGGEKSRGKIEKNSKIFTAEIAALRAREDAEGKGIEKTDHEFPRKRQETEDE